jgi:hypothetical protein
MIDKLEVIVYSRVRRFALILTAVRRVIGYFFAQVICMCLLSSIGPGSVFDFYVGSLHVALHHLTCT